MIYECSQQTSHTDVSKSNISHLIGQTDSVNIEQDYTDVCKYYDIVFESLTTT